MPVLHIQAPGMPWFAFEWHPGVIAKVYVVRVATARATPIAENVHTQAEAELAVNAFLAGYRERSQEPSLFRGDGPRHYRMTAETGKLGITGQNQ